MDAYTLFKQMEAQAKSAPSTSSAPHTQQEWSVCRLTPQQGYSHPQNVPHHVLCSQEPTPQNVERPLGLANLTLPELPAELNDLLKNMPNFFNDDDTVYDFPDDSMMGKKALVLKRLSNAQTIKLGVELMEALENGISEYHVGLIFLVAFQLKKQTFGRLELEHSFPEKFPVPHVLDFEVDNLDKSVYEEKIPRTNLIKVGSERELCISLPAMAASLLTLFMRSPDNYTKSWQYILSTHAKFYHIHVPFRGIVISQNNINRIHGHFSLTEVFKTTLYRFLYMSNEGGSISGIQHFLYDNHLSHTGLHGVSMACALCKSLKCPPSIFLRIMYAKRYEGAITGLELAFKYMENTDDQHWRQMWKYGRIFNDTFMKPLHTKNCARFIFTMAAMLKRVDAEAYAGIYNIRQFDQISVGEKKHLEDGARELWLEIQKANEEHQHLLGKFTKDV